MKDPNRQAAPPFAGAALERELDKPRSEWGVEDLLDVARDRKVRALSLMHVGGDGWLKTLDFVPGGEAHLRDIILAGERADGSSLFPDFGIPSGASDIVLRPRTDSAFLDPFSPLPTLVLMCGHAARNGDPLPESPDTILRRADETLREQTGVELWALGEVEYFLGKRWDESDIYGADDRGYHATSPFVFGEALRREAMATLAEIGVAVKYGHSEVGYIEAMETEGVIWEQHEIELALRPLPEAAESILLTQWVLRNLAHRHGMRCSTDPMMLEGHAGNGLHFHFGARRDGCPVPVRGEDGDLSEPAAWLIGGLVQLGGALMAFGNRVESSFGRLDQAKEAPSAIVWGEYDRNALIRLPIVARDESGRVVTQPTVEFRLPDGSALPHLLLAGAALAMIRGRETGNLGELLGRTFSSRAADSEVEAVPRSFRDVAEALERQRSALERGDAFPSSLLGAFIHRLRS